MITIREFNRPDWDSVWPIVKKVFRAGETYVYSPDTTRDEAFQIWIETPAATFVAVDGNNQVVGTYYIKPNQPALGSHVCNCGYIVAQKTRGQGIATAMCVHSQAIAKEMGFRAMQYNLVVSTNTGAIRLWQRLGFEVIGVLPGAFNHGTEGFVDALIMYKQLKN